MQEDLRTQHLSASLAPASPILDSDALFEAEKAVLPGKHKLVLQAYQLSTDCDVRWGKHGSQSSLLRKNLQSVGLPTISGLHTAPLPVAVNGKIVGWTFISCLDYTTGEHHAALVLGDPERGCLKDGKDILVRIHSASKLPDNFFGLSGTTERKMEESMSRMVAEGCGVIIFLQQDGRGHGVGAHLESLNRRYRFTKDGSIERRLSNGRPVSLSESFAEAGYGPDGRDYSAATEILERLNISSVRLITSRPAKGLLNGINVSLEKPSWKDQEPWDNSQKRNYPHASNVNFLDRCFMPNVENHRLRLEMLAHCSKLDSEAQMPWTTVARRRAILSAVGHPIVRRLGAGPAPTRFGDWTLVAYGDYTTGEVHRALVYGDLDRGALNGGEEIPMRPHSSCDTNEVLRATNCECRFELAEAMTRIKDQGKGVILYLQQEGRGAGIEGKIKQLQGMFEFDKSGTKIVQRKNGNGLPVSTYQAYVDAGYPAEARDFSVAGAMLQDLGVKSVEMFTNNPRKVNGVRSAGITVRPSTIIADVNTLADPALVASELHDKRENLGHQIDASLIARVF